MAREKYLGSSTNISPERAYTLITRELRKERNERNKIRLPTIKLDITTNGFNCYVDLGFHINIHEFGNSLDKIYGIERVMRLPAHLIGREYLEGGGITRAYKFRDREKNIHQVWTTFYKKDREDIVNIFVKAHEEAHVAYELGAKNEIVRELKSMFRKLSFFPLEDESDELLSTLSGFMPLIEMGVEPRRLVSSLNNYDNTIERELKRSLELIS